MQYNRSLDFIISAAVKLAQGKHELAAALMVKASREPSFAKAIQILEASNERAFAIQARAAEQRRRVIAAEQAEDEDLSSMVSDISDLDDDEEVTAGEQAPDRHPSVDEGEPTEVLERQARSRDTVAASASRFARALAATARRR